MRDSLSSRLFAFLCFSVIPAHILALPPSPAGPQPDEPPPTTPAPNPLDGTNNAPVHIDVCYGNIYKNCVFNYHPPGANAAPDARLDGGGGGGGGGAGGGAGELQGHLGEDGVYTVTVVEVVTSTRIIYVQGTQPADSSAGGQKMARDVVAEGVDSVPNPQPVPQPQPPVQNQPGPDNGNFDDGPNIDPFTEELWDSEFTTLKNVNKGANAFKAMFGQDKVAASQARKVHLYWDPMREEICRTCVALAPRADADMSSEAEKKYSAAIGMNWEMFSSIKRRLVS